MTPRLSWNVSAVLLGTVLLAGCGEERRRGNAPRHALVVTLEGVRADRTSAYLHSKPTTWFEVSPEGRAQGHALSLDDLAAEGVLFAHAFATEGDAPASVASAFGGEAWGLAPGDSDGGLAGSAAKAGYRTVAIVGGAARTLPEALRSPFEQFLIVDDDEALVAALDELLAEDPFGGDRPLLLWLHLASATFPFTPPAVQHEELGREVDFVTLFGDLRSVGITGTVEERAELGPGPEELSEEQAKTLSALYDSDVAYTNYQLWRALVRTRRAAAASGAWEDTLLIVAGISGVELDRPGVPWGSAGRPTDASLRVPFLMRHPRSLCGRRVMAGLVAVPDLAPTVAGWLQLPAPERSGDERNLLAYADLPFGETLPPRAVASRLEDGAVWTVRDADWRLVATRAALEADARAEAQLFVAGDDRPEPEDHAARQPEDVERLWTALRARALGSDG